MSTITSEKKGVYIDVTPKGESRSYNRLGLGINTITVNNNPTVTKSRYVNQSFSSATRTGIEKSWSISGEVYEGDSVNDYLLSLSEKTGSEVETTLVVVALSKRTEDKGVVTYPATRYKIIVNISNDGSLEGGEVVKFDGTLEAQGDPVEGTATIGEGDVATFTATV